MESVQLKLDDKGFGHFYLMEGAEQLGECLHGHTHTTFFCKLQYTNTIDHGSKCKRCKS